MPRILAFAFLMILSPALWGQDFIVDPDFADLGNRYYSRVMGIEYEPETDTYMVAGSFDGGEPYTPCLNRINDLGEDDFFWNPEDFETCTGVLNNFFPTPNGYRFGADMLRISDEGNWNTLAIPDFSGTEQITTWPPRGWSDDNGAIYTGSNWLLTEEEGEPETCLLVFSPQGERYEPFPLLRCGHPFFEGDLTDIYEYDNERLMVGGGFDSLNGHTTIRVGRIFKNGTVDTTFSSQLESHFRGFIQDVDSQGRILVHQPSGGSEAGPADTLELFRLMPDGSLDPTWNPVDLANAVDNTTGSAARTSIRMDDGSYIIYGKFRFVNGQPRNAICQLDSTGVLMDTFAGEAFEKDIEAHPQLAALGPDPHVMAGVRTPDGGLLLGGIFTHYNGLPHLNLVKLIPDSTVGTTTRDFPVRTKVYPNPARDQIRLELSNPKNLAVGSVQLVDLSGRTVASYPWQGKTQTIDIGHLASGVYLLQLRNNNTVLGVEKLVVN